MTGSKDKLKVKRRPFLLLEVLIALVIVILCAYPLLSTHFFIYKTEKKFAKTAEAHRLVNSVFGYIVEQLYANKILWKDVLEQTIYPLTDKEKTSLGFPTDFPYDVAYQVTPMLKKGSHTKLRKKIGKAGLHDHLIIITIQLIPKLDHLDATDFVYHLYVERRVIEGKELSINAEAPIAEDSEEEDPEDEDPEKELDDEDL